MLWLAQKLYPISLSALSCAYIIYKHYVPIHYQLYCPILIFEFGCGDWMSEIIGKFFKSSGISVYHTTGFNLKKKK